MSASKRLRVAPKGPRANSIHLTNFTKSPRE